LEVIVATVAVNVALLCPAPTLTVAGTVTFPLPLVTPTVAPDPPAAVSVMVQVELPGAFTAAGAQLNVLGCTGPVCGTVRSILTVWLTPFSVAVTTTVVAMAPAVAVKVALLCPAPTLTVAGTLNSFALALNKSTVTAAGVAIFSVTVQVLVALMASDVGAQVKLVSWGNVLVGWGAVAERVNVCEPPFRLAVSNAV
jgi:hypothetical protein